jgi:thiamine biosynthesis lipoprotein
MKSSRFHPSPAGSLAIVLAAFVFSGCAEPGHVESEWDAMGGTASAEIHATTQDVADTAEAEVRAAIERIDSVMSNWRPDSELARLNREAARGLYAIEDRDLYRCVKFALDYARATDGAFDPTVGPLVRAYGFRPREPRVPGPGELSEARGRVGWRKVELVKVARSIRFRDPGVELDLGGIARGYALDVATRVFARIGCQGGLLRLGTEAYAWNKPPGRESWSVVVTDPRDPSRAMFTLDLANRAVSSSSTALDTFTIDGQEFGAVMDPAEGWPARSDVVSATAIADSGADADAMSTALVVAGSRRGSEVLRRSRRMEAVLLVRGEDGLALLASASLKNRLRVAPEFENEIEGTIRFLLPPLALE